METFGHRPTWLRHNELRRKILRDRCPPFVKRIHLVRQSCSHCGDTPPVVRPSQTKRRHALARACRARTAARNCLRPPRTQPAVAAGARVRAVVLAACEATREERTSRKCSVTRKRLEECATGFASAFHHLGTGRARGTPRSDQARRTRRG